MPKAMSLTASPPLVDTPRTASESLFLAAFEDAGIGLALLDRHGQVMTANAALQDLLGVAPARIGDALVTDEAGKRCPGWAALCDGAKARIAFQKHFIRPDGLGLDARITLTAAERRRGGVLVAVVEDVSDQTRMLDALFETEEKFRSIFENAAEGIFQAAPDGRYFSANPALARIFGYQTADELLAEGADLVKRLYVDWARRADIARLLEANDAVRDFESQVLRRDGSLIWVREHCRAVRDDQGRLLHIEGIVEDSTAQKEAEDRLIHDALHDQLTGLPNRNLFLDRLGYAMRVRERMGTRYAVMFIDCDRFKLINDSLGHAAGDLMLVELARRIGRCLRASDSLARLGGDEFAVLACELDGHDDAVRIAERIRAQLAEPFSLEGQDCFVTTSIGIAYGNPDYVDPMALLRDADTAMYAAKARGRDGHVVFEPGMHHKAVSQLQLGNDLRRALENEELFVEYQPIVALADSSLAGFEALVRWQHPTQGLIGPDHFIPLAEDTGLIHPIGDWVLASAARQMAAWQRHLPAARALFIGVNLAPAQLQRPGIVDILTGIVRSAGLRPESLRIEITETGIMGNPAAAKHQLEAMRDVGYRLAIDDFGTGYSSLAHLHRFPIDCLKIDRSFIAPMLQGGDPMEIVRTILLLARSLSMSVVAEGVETARHHAILRELGCAYGQGWHYDRALDSVAAAARIAGQAR